jgi:hypothetical protein
MQKELVESRCEKSAKGNLARLVSARQQPLPKPIQPAKRAKAF